MRLKETKEVEAMIKRIEQSGGGSDYPFPQGPKTNAYIEAGQTVTIDFEKMKTVLEAKGVDLTKYITDPEEGGTKKGDMVLGTGYPSGCPSNLMIDYREDVPGFFSYSNIFGAYTEDVRFEAGITIAEALTIYGVKTYYIENNPEGEGPYVNFGVVYIHDIDNNEQGVQLTEDEVTQYISFS